MRQSGDWTDAGPMDRISLLQRLRAAIRQLNVTQARQEADRFISDKASLELWSAEFFLEIVDRIETV